MCGIYLAISRNGYVEPSSKTRELLQRRGPDSVQELRLEFDAGSTGLSQDGSASHEPSKTYITCVSTVLSLRGDHTVNQPVRSNGHLAGAECESFLCWNGEAWKIDNTPVQGNDSEQVFVLLSAIAKQPNSRPMEDLVAEALAHVSGPYAFAFFDPVSQTVHFGRDFLGRRSLLYTATPAGDLVLTSVSDANDGPWHEVEADGVYTIDLAQPSLIRSELRKVPYLYSNPAQPGSGKGSLPPLELNKACPSEGESHPALISSSASVSALEALLRRSLDIRITTIPQRTVAPEKGSSHDASRLAVLFSGGLDCTVLARLAHDIVDSGESIDLLNVAFQNPRVHRQAETDPNYSPYELCPDRITGRASFAELQRVCPDRHWRFVAVNVPYSETVAHRSEVMTLIHPHNTGMDLSIAYALYFAARGCGSVADSPDGPVTSYTTTARVLLSGLGADELFGGYTRHATAFRRAGYQGLIDELELDISRLGKRNLGRDDRVFSTWGREARFPFLDEDFVKWALQAPVWEKCGFGEHLPADETDGSLHLEPGKKVLRGLAWKLGMTGVAAEKKRAIQFGARTAKMEAGRTRGTQVLT